MMILRLDCAEEVRQKMVPVRSNAMTALDEMEFRIRPHDMFDLVMRNETFNVRTSGRAALQGRVQVRPDAALAAASHGAKAQLLIVLNAALKRRSSTVVLERYSSRY